MFKRRCFLFGRCSLFAGGHYGAHSPTEAKSGYPYFGGMEMCASRVH